MALTVCMYYCLWVYGSAGYLGLGWAHLYVCLQLLTRHLMGGSCGCPKLEPVEPLGLSTQSHSPVGWLKFVLTVDPASRTVSRTAQALLRPA